MDDLLARRVGGLHELGWKLCRLQKHGQKLCLFQQGSGRRNFNIAFYAFGNVFNIMDTQCQIHSFCTAKSVDQH